MLKAFFGLMFLSLFSFVSVAAEPLPFFSMTSEVHSFKRGLYQHYSGSFYQVIGVGRHSETLEEYVIYQALSGDYGLWMRPRAMFEEMVEINGKKKPRFKFIRVLLEEPPLLRK